VSASVPAIAQPIVERCLAVRRAHPSWGPLKVRAFLERQAPSIDWPAPSTIGWSENVPW
jgi:putative transposase